jgi:hypothetical protein
MRTNVPPTVGYTEGRSWQIEPDGDHAAISVCIGIAQRAGGAVHQEIALDRDFDRDDALTSRQARQLASALIAAAGELEALA